MLLVGNEREHQIPWRHDSGLTKVAGNHNHHAHHVLHVDRATTPDVAVFDGAGKRVHTPFGRFSRHHIEMPVDQQRAARTIGARQPGEHVAAAGRTGFNVFRLVADFGELLGDPACALGLTLGGPGFATVGGIEPD
ncbi:Uncharacterised protein [Mycobacterium tuberculosis]|uniref:Uncharacterized protein n=1 Tax=Mycobacterium tuberculosis TaxID=1773 RepID=A0A655FMG3_MYCTX|nr:Uncharacterised protein [Mycobacterium tuberculosis]CKR96850.1 Uncharacterised protein [Mycobacterium tuberculosis]CKT72110.1 Uncharacterised protein [Mycobacterium tuberculosis]CKV37846.1 Uncharacterised protein [Mycobacterium tuberculosis]CNV85126.1 Uncharacterised protein [Mycobacterium tuberculosis]